MKLKLSSDQKGFSSLFLLIGIILICALFGIYIFRSNVTDKKVRISDNVDTITSPAPLLTPNQVSCNISFKLPATWKAKNVGLPLSNATGLAELILCTEITAPDYMFGNGEWSGGVVRMSRVKVGSKLLSITINNIDDYIKWMKDQEEIEPKDAIYSGFRGKSFISSGYQVENNFVFIKDNYVYIISWSTEEKYKNDVDLILNSIKL